jgi:hypothetical protein
MVKPVDQVGTVKLLKVRRELLRRRGNRRRVAELIRARSGTVIFQSHGESLLELDFSCIFIDLSTA